MNANGERDMELLQDELRLCCELKREYQEAFLKEKESRMEAQRLLEEYKTENTKLIAKVAQLQGAKRLYVQD